MKDFKGEEVLLKKYNEITLNIEEVYRNGTSICFAGPLGIGKTFTVSNILKKATHKNFTCLYSTLSDMVSALTSGSNEDKYLSRKELMMVDFLAIEEFDPRYMPTENASDFYGRTLENIFRTRSQNKLPIFMSTNSPNIVEAFSGTIKQSIESLMTGYVKIIPIFGNDFRKTK